MKVAVVHDWLTTAAGAEQVLEQILLAYPQAELHAVVDFLPPDRRGLLHGHAVQTSFIQRLPFARRLFRAYVMLMPFAVEQFDLSGYDLVISSSHAVAKGVLTGPDTVHVGYIHSPMRYAWDLQHQYLRESGLDRGLRGALARLMLARLRRWDTATAGRPDVLLANSAYVARRIRKAWGRTAIVIPPPVDVDTFTPGDVPRGGTYLVAARQVAYKRIDLIAAAFAAMPERRLLIVGDGPAHGRIRAAAAGAANVAFRPAVPRAELVALMRAARAFVFAAEEDFGIVMAEALACGTPVIAYGRGGAAEIVEAGRTGVLFAEQTPSAIADAVARFEAVADGISPTACRQAAMRFAPDSFRVKLQQAISRALAG